MNPIIVRHQNPHRSVIEKKLPSGSSSVSVLSVRTEYPTIRIVSSPQHSSLCTIYIVFWSGRADLNGRPLAPQASTLPGCATPRHALFNSTVFCIVPWSLLECNRLRRARRTVRQSECDSIILRIAWRFPRSFCASSLGGPVGWPPGLAWPNIV